MTNCLLAIMARFLVLDGKLITMIINLLSFAIQEASKRAMSTGLSSSSIRINYKLMTWLFFLFCTCVMPKAFAQGQIIPRDTLLHCIVDLTCDTTITRNGQTVNAKFSGTGMFVTKGQQDLYLVTAAHVAKDMGSKAYIIFYGPHNTPKKLRLLDIISETKPIWIYHLRADLAVIKLHPKPSLLSSGALNNHFVPLEFISKDSTRTVSRDIQLTVIGFPFSLGIEGRFSPLTYRTFSASDFITLSRADIHTPCEFVVLENPSVGGYSGGPVFDLSVTVINGMTATGSGTMCYGFIHGTLSDETGGKLAAVTPSYFLFDLIR